MLLEGVVATGACVVVTWFTARLLWPWLPRDLAYLWAVIKLTARSARQVRSKTFIIDLFEQKIKTCGGKTFIRFEDRQYTYQEVNDRAKQTAWAASELGLAFGDVVALFAVNEPEYIWTYLGLMKLGLPIAFINNSLRAGSLVHCLRTSGAKDCIVSNDSSLTDAIQDVKAEIPEMRVFSLELKPRHMMIESFQTIVSRMPLDEIDKSVRSKWVAQDTVGYTYTSGTTGLPKAASVTHLKSVRASCLLHMCQRDANDVVYLTLPLFHAYALHVVVGSVIRLGASLVLRKKFSASNFWTDCRKYDVTVVACIGELCRYLLAKPTMDTDRNNRVRLALTSGLRKDIWDEFQTRFCIPKIVEFYAATECPVSFVNLNNVPGSIGLMSPLIRRMSNSNLIKFDPTTEQPVRNDEGFCIPVEMGETGLMIVRKTALTPFDGYKDNEEASKKKLLTDVLVKGDCYFNSGDLMVVDKNYNLFFSDRIGDTFRWKGENVSTLEVSNVLNELPFLVDACVYGVTVPGCEGRAGMASMSLHGGKVYLSSDQIRDISKHCLTSLPSYAVPRFIRVDQQVTMTATFKHKKVSLVEAGFDPTKVGTSLYVFDQETQAYTELTDDLHTAIVGGKFRL